MQVNIEKNYKKYIKLSRKQPKYIKDHFTLEHMTTKFSEIIEKHVKIPEAVGLKLPKLKKVGADKAPANAIKLPKLKKVEA